MLLSCQGDGKSWSDVTSCSSYSEFCPYIPLAAHSTDVLPMGTDAGPAAAQGCFVTWHSLREGVAGKGELSRQQRALACPAEQKWGELNPSLCPALPTSCVLGSTSRLLSKLLWVFFGLCEEIKMFFKWYSNAEVLRHWASFFTDVWEPCLQGNWGQSRI